MQIRAACASSFLAVGILLIALPRAEGVPPPRIAADTLPRVDTASEVPTDSSRAAHTDTASLVDSVTGSVVHPDTASQLRPDTASAVHSVTGGAVHPDTSSAVHADTSKGVASDSAAPRAPAAPTATTSPTASTTPTAPAAPDSALKHAANTTETPVPPAGDTGSIPKKLTFEEALAQLLRENPEIRKARQVWLAARARYRGSFGIFEPALVGSWEYQETDRPHLIYGQTQVQYSGGIEGSLPTATKYNLGFSFTDLSNKFIDNVNRPTAFSGITLTQPLLQGLWFGKPTAEIRAARAEQSAALNRFRSALCAAIGELQGSYWKLRYAQDKLRFARQSVAMAEEIVADSRVEYRVGKISQVETVEAAAGLANRQAAVSTAQIELNTAVSELQILITGNRDLIRAPIEAASEMRAPSRPILDSLSARLDSGKTLDLQPDFLEKKFQTEKQQVAYDAQIDQCLPELTVKGMWGYQVSGTNSAAVWNNFTDGKYRSNATTYSAGVEVRVPLGFNIKERNAKSAERHALRQAEIDQNAIRGQLENYVRISLKRLNELRSNIDNASIVVDYRRTLLQAEIGRQKAGKSDYHKIFEMEDELTKAKLSELENTVEILSTRGQLQRLTGTTLTDLGLETIEDGVPVPSKRILDPGDRP